MGYTIVTGAGTGLGKALTDGLVARGHRVAMMGRRHQKLQAQEQRFGEQVIGIAADLSHLEEVEMAFSAAAEWGGLPDMVIHCAGVGEFGPVGVYTAEQIRSVVENNLISTILVAQQTVRLLGDRGGVLANVLSSAAQVGKANESLYCASKWGMRGFLESLRAELRGGPLRLVNLYPSGIRSEFWDNSNHVDPSRFMTPEDAAAYMLDALASRTSCHVTDLFIGRND
ncbi:SDR family NAD(P)-dependent oxidoreductase [Aeromonas schubertii]|uniref:SDR family NAD(P)-dependent oxidoreductase n=1 Tax=Aeromonas schubertii TaxID=652 RepID=A0A0S2SGS2_9GAMM|nr:SDR family NAD(P)-dependent oxidoreductase [Aeromonas schubertii]ALP40899.1 short chain dehydrogenase/reductase family oxidoreductase [Aeromonas schubertii]KUE81063.1 short-chain dehydrogenase [Aeromonas schubertii]MBZ6066949.1 SDR family NAD(P)-dependent oxidoreductase [Aeromonas schubertii]MBZ6070793.1 SDR family NAD(P)-dependent oxidoreductase [Aeromonas schubertii]QCG47205.1 SDR family NAD(P)-dependent oxidoreductase [Aeromonas schubertii]